MNLPTEVFGNVVVVHTPSELTDGESAELADFLTSQQTANVVVDLDGTEVLTSASLACLLDANDELRLNNGHLRITTSNSVNRKILEITRLDQQIDVYSSVVEAMKG